MLKKLRIRENESNRKYAHRVIKESILDYYLKPGQMFSEIEAAKILGLSRTPIREALILLEEEKLIEVKPQKGTFVTHLNLELIYNAIFFRQTIEKSVIRLACLQEDKTFLEEMKNHLIVQKAMLSFEENGLEIFIELDDKFHQCLYLSVNKGEIWEAINKVSIPYNRIRRLDVLEKISLERILEQHELLLKIIENNDLDAISNLVDEHLTNIFSKMEIIEMKYPNYFN